MSFIPLILKKTNKYQAESALKYFLTQAIASVFILLRLCLIKTPTIGATFILTLGLLLKVAAAPLHQWITSLSEGLSWPTLLILLRPQKLGPLTLISNVVAYKPLLVIFIILRAILGRLGGLSQPSLKKILAYSSIAHMGWVLSAMLLNSNIWFNYFIIYRVILSAISIIFKISNFSKLSHIYLNNTSSTQIITTIRIMSLAGLPPFSGFLGKLIVILELSHSNFNFILIPILLGTLIRLFFYLRVALINIIKTKSQLTLTNLKPKNKTPILLINLIALFAAGPVFILILDFKLFKLKAFKALKKGVLKSSKS